MTDFMMPPTGFGPGSQPMETGDDKLDYMSLPQDMSTYSPHLPDIDDLEPGRIKPALDLLADIAEAAAEIARAGGSRQFELSGFDAENRALLAETLGSGEVAAKIHSIPAIAVQESVFAGVWTLQSAGRDVIEVAAIPTCVTDAAFAPRRAGQGSETPLQPGVLNAPPLLVELLDKSGAFDPRAPLHVINLSLLPHTAQDLKWLDEAVGEGRTTILSRGYGNCRVTATALEHVWRVQFYNSMDTLILDTFEVTTIPEVVLAAPEDLADTSDRIKAVLEAIQ